MIGSDLEGAGLDGADLEGRVAGWAASATIDDAAAVRETQPARLRQLFVLERAGAGWKIAQYMYQQMPEQF